MTHIRINCTDDNLKEAAGTRDNEKLRQKAGDLNTHATSLESSLETELSKQSDDAAAQAAKGKVDNLKDAASKDDPSDDKKGLKQLLEGLNNASGFELVSKGKLVLAKYNDVVSKYNDVAADTTASGKEEQFGNVKAAFDALQTEFDEIKRLDKFLPFLLSGLIP